MAFSSYSNIVSGLPTTSGYKYYDTFIYNNELYVLYGMNNYAIVAYKWNGSAWGANSEFATFDVAPGNGMFPTVFYYNSELYLICGKVSGTGFLGYKWNAANLRWEQNAAIISGLTSITQAYTCPDVFTHNNNLSLIYGETNGMYYGYVFNGSAWVSTPSIVAGLPDIGSYSRSQILQYNGNLYLINKADIAWKWNESLTTWETTTFFTGAYTGASVGKAAVFEFSNYLYYFQTNNLTSILGYRYAPGAKISSLSIESYGNCTARFKVNLSAPLDPGETFLAYLSNSIANYGNPAFLVELYQLNSTTWAYDSNYEEATVYAFQVLERWENTTLQTISINGTWFALPAMSATVINITDANNYHIFSSPQHAFNHGLIFSGGYIFGSARNYPTVGATDIFKIEAANYANIFQKTIYTNKNASTGRITHFDQIIQACGFVWVHSGQYLIRINQADLDYMVFSGVPAADNGEPPCTDGTYIYLTAGTAAQKLDISLLTGTFASYSYTGDVAVTIPAPAIVTSCNFIQYAPGPVYCHSSAVDNLYLYLQCSTSGYSNGMYNGEPVCHLQKIRKTDFVTVGDVIIPRSTDDMVQNSEYLFLGPELGGPGADQAFGATWGLFAVKKTTLEIKHLKALKPGSLPSAATNAAYGVFYFGNKITLQTSSARETYVVNISNIENWNESLPIGGATDAYFIYQLNGVNLTVPNNELILDQNGLVHTNTWEANTMLFKFNLSQITTAVKTPNIATSLISATSNSATIGGLIIDEGNSPVTAVGFNYGTAPGSLINNVPVTPLVYDFQTVLSSLTPGIYYIQAYGTNTEGTFYGNIVIFSTYNALTLAHNSAAAALAWLNQLSGCSIRCVQDAPGVADGVTGTATDADGNQYNTIVINQKRWFIENLKTTKYRNGDPIPEVTDGASWAALSTGARCNYN